MNSGPHKRICEWNDCPKEGRYRIQASADQNDIHWFCAIHARTFDLSVVNKGPFFGAASSGWTQKQNSSSENNEEYHKPYADIKSDVRMKHIGSEKTLNYTKENLDHLKTLGLDTGANKEEIKKVYKTLVKHCHPDQNPDFDHGNYIFTKITEAYNALKNKDFK